MASNPKLQKFEKVSGTEGRNTKTVISSIIFYGNTRSDDGPVTDSSDEEDNTQIYGLARCQVCKRPQLRSRYQCEDKHFICKACFLVVESGSSRLFKIGTCPKCSKQMAISNVPDLEKSKHCDKNKKM